MTEKYERQCWNCGGKDLEDMGDHVKCRSCGATWNEIAPLSPDPRSGKSNDKQYIKILRK